MDTYEQNEILKEIQNQLNGKQAGTVTVAENYADMRGGWIGKYFIADCASLDDTYYLVAVHSALQGLSIIYIQAPHDILGALIGKGGENASVVLALLNANGFAADRISFKDASVPPVVYE